jgi:ferredoxin-thioredoxin reductase catalytic subunit/predicted RNA-binding Zn-ribbon protein involved in translation (DUF1610 family)
MPNIQEAIVSWTDTLKESLFKKKPSKKTSMERPLCRVCAKALESQAANTEVTCVNCGTRNRITYSQSECIEGVQADPEQEFRERIDEIARLRNYTFNDSKERVIRALLRKREKYGDFYCPCKAKVVLANICPCEETRNGSVELYGKCSCSLFWKR